MQYTASVMRTQVRYVKAVILHSNNTDTTWSSNVNTSKKMAFFCGNLQTFSLSEVRIGLFDESSVPGRDKYYEWNKYPTAWGE